MTLIYIPGLFSEQSSTFMNLKNTFENIHLCNYNTLNNYDYKVIHAYIDAFIREHTTSDFGLVGTSFGGYWANVFAEHYHMPVVLINPSVTPQTNLIKYQFPIDLKDYQSVPDTLELHKSIVVGIHDTICDPKMTQTYFQQRPITVIDAGHRLEPVHYPLIQDLVHALKSTSSNL